jgi:hypothetical protein
MNMDNKIPTPQTAARKLNKPARDPQEMDREELVTYTDESGGESTGSGKPAGN